MPASNDSLGGHGSGWNRVNVDSDVAAGNGHAKAEHLADHREQIGVQQAAAREKQAGRGFWQGTSGR
jgi:hypothetical protein